LDSVTPEALQAAVASGARVERHPVDKDATDLELALEAALTAGVGRVIVVGGSGGRMDHFLANALLLASPRFAALRPEWWTDGTRVVAIHDSADFSGRVGDLLTLLAVGGAATGVSSEGLKWPLRADTLQPGSTRGVSNEFTGESARVSVDSGVLLGVHQRRER
ncbi:MAG: thiamine diphosphokinase, partial [Acidimicrobiia bacterium]